MVAAGFEALEVAHHPRERVVEDGDAALEVVRGGGELLGLGQLGGEVGGQALVPLPEDVDGEAAGVLDEGSVRAVLSKQTSTSSGSSESEQTALAVMPPPGAVMMATPVGKRPKASRKRMGSGSGIAPSFKLV